MHQSLIFDIGMHTAQDTRFYLAKGFRVVAVEANPRLCRRIRRQFRVPIADGRLVVVEAAISDTPGSVDLLLFRSRLFKRRDEYSALENHFAQRNVVEKKLRHRRIRVHALSLETVLERYGVPYYLKLDIEGGELGCLRALRTFSDRPAFVSAEIDYLRSDVCDATLAEFERLGYTRFKIVPQGAHPSLSKETPQLEGLSCDYVFERGSSGPFGKDTPGDWSDINGVRAVVATGLSNLLWHDLHAAR